MELWDRTVKYTNIPEQHVEDSSDIMSLYYKAKTNKRHLVLQSHLTAESG